MWISLSKVMLIRKRRGRKAFWRSHRFLHRGRRLSRSFTSRRSRIGETRFIPPPSSAFRRWKIFIIGDASVRIFLPIFKMNFPEIVDMALPPEGVFHNLVFVSIRKQYPYQAFKMMHGLWGMGQMMFSKYIIVVDEDCDVHNTSEVLFRLCANTDPQRDSTIIKNPSDSLDHAPSRAEHRIAHGLRCHTKTPGEDITATGRSSSG